MRKQLISFAQVIKFCKISSARGVLTPTPLHNRAIATQKACITNKNMCKAGKLDLLAIFIISRRFAHQFKWASSGQVSEYRLPWGSPLE